MSLSRGDIVLLPFPWTDLSATKVRPALVISDTGFNKKSEDAVFLFITSKLYSSEYDYFLDADDPSFSKTGLKQSSTFRLSKLITLEQSLVQKRLGILDQKHLKRISSALKVLLDI